MSETTATILVAAITALGSIVTALIGWLARKGVNFMDQKTKVLDEASALQRKEAIKNKIVDAVTLAARATMQTYVDEVKARNADGKLTKEDYQKFGGEVDRLGVVLSADKDHDSDVLAITGAEAGIALLTDSFA